VSTGDGQVPVRERPDHDGRGVSAGQRVFL